MPRALTEASGRPITRRATTASLTTEYTGLGEPRERAGCRCPGWPGSPRRSVASLCPGATSVFALFEPFEFALRRYFFAFAWAAGFVPGWAAGLATSLAASFAHASFSVTLRLNTTAPGRLSWSTQK